MSRMIASLLLASALCATPLLTSAQDFSNTPLSVIEQFVPQPSEALPGEAFTAEAVFEEDEDSGTPWTDEQEVADLDDALLSDLLTQNPPVVSSDENAIDAPWAAQTAQAWIELPQDVADAISAGEAASTVLAIDDAASAPVTGIAQAYEPVVEVTIVAAETSAPASSDIATATTDFATLGDMLARLEDMPGKEVIDQRGEFMGTVTGIDEESSLAQVETPDGRIIALKPETMTDMGNGIIEATISDGIVTAADPAVSDFDILTIETE